MRKGTRTTLCATPKDLKNSPKQPQTALPRNSKVFEIEGSNFVIKPLRGNETAWWRLPVRKGPRTPPCAAPRGLKNSPKQPQTALPRKTQNF